MSAYHPHAALLLGEEALSSGRPWIGLGTWVILGASHDRMSSNSKYSRSAIAPIVLLMRAMDAGIRIGQRELVLAGPVKFAEKRCASLPHAIGPEFNRMLSKHRYPRASQDDCRIKQLCKRTRSRCLNTRDFLQANCGIRTVPIG